MSLERHDAPSPDVKLEGFIQRCLDGLGHQVQGNSAPFLEVWSHADDVLIVGAIGSYAQGWENVRTRLLGASKSLDWSGLSVERLLTTASGDLALTVMLEHDAPPLIDAQLGRAGLQVQLVTFDSVGGETLVVGIVPDPASGFARGYAPNLARTAI